MGHLIRLSILWLLISDYITLFNYYSKNQINKMKKRYFPKQYHNIALYILFPCVLYIDLRVIGKKN